MKRLGVFACIIVATLSLFGGFSRPEKVFAAPPGTFNSAIQEMLDVFTSPNSIKAKFQDSYTSKQRVEYGKAIKALKDYASVRTQDAPVDRSKNAFKIDTLDDFAIYLNGRIRDETDPDLLKVIKDTLSLRNNLHTAVALEGFDQGYYMAAAIGGGGVVESEDQVKSAAAAGVASSQEFGSEKKGVCAINVFGGESFSLGTCINEGVTWLIKNTLLQIAGFLVWITANMLNYVIQVGILDFSTWAPPSLYPLWIIVRQIVSLVIVFVGLYLGFLYIIGDPKGKFEHYIPWVIIFGLFVNFSYPLARTAIDISNIVSLKVYVSAVGSDALVADPSNAVNIFNSQHSAGALIMNKLGLQGLIGSAVNTDTAGGILGGISGIPGSLMAVIFVLYAAYIFFMVTAILAARTAVLVILTVASPILLVDSVLPLLGDRAVQLRKIFFEQLAVGPVFMIMLALTLKFLDVFSTGLKSISGATSGGAATITTFFNLFMMLIMLHIMITVTKKVSGEIGTFATGKMGQVGGFGLGVASAGTGFLARQGIGRAVDAAKRGGWVSKDPDSVTGRIANTLTSSSYDFRNTAAAGGMKKLGMGMGMGSKMGYEEASQAKTKKIIDQAARIKTRYERDVYEKDSKGNVVFNNGIPVIKEKQKKGDVDEKAERERTQYLNRNGARFLTKGESERIQNEVADNEGKGMLEEYKKIKSKTDRDLHTQDLKKQLEELKKTDPKLEGGKAIAIAQTLTSISKEEESFKEQVSNLIERYGRTKEEKRESFLTNIDNKDLRDEVTKKVKESNNQASAPSTATQVPTPSPIITPQELTVETPEQLRKRLGGEQPQASSASVDIDLNVPLDINTMSFAARAAAKRQAAVAQAGRQAEQNMAANQQKPSSPDPVPDEPAPAPKSPNGGTSSTPGAPSLPTRSAANESHLASTA